MYRPQFAYATPPGCKDEDFAYFFDGSNTPLLNQGLFSGQYIDNIPLVLEQDAPFYWRGWKIELRHVATGGCPPTTTTTYITPDLAVRFRDCYENYLSDGLIPATEYGFAQNPLQFLGQFVIGPPVLVEPEIYCPRGGVINLYLRGGVSLGAVDPTITNLVSVTLYGVKRFQECNR